LAITGDKRNLVITSHKITSLKGLFSRLQLNKKRRSSAGASGGGGNSNAGGGGGGGSSADAASASTKVISLEAIDRVQRGASTHKFVLARHEAQTTGNVIGGGGSGGEGSNSASSVLLKLLNDSSPSSSSSQPCCVSIIYYCSGNGNNGGNSSSSDASSLLHLETLDLVVPDLTEYETLVTCLEDLHHLHCQERLRTSSHLQRLQAQWVAMGRAWHEPLREADFLALCDRLQVPLKRAVLSILFR
jgi:hypothetical protein